LGQKASEAKIGDLKDGYAWRMPRLNGAVIWRLQKEILRFDVAVHDVLAAQEVQRGR
jgi:hypothetical protein